MSRTKDKINRYLFQSQSTYRKSRSTTDITWARKWIITKNTNTRCNNLRYRYRYVKCIRLNSKRATNRHRKEILNKDEIRILRVLLAETTSQVKIEIAPTTIFESNIGLPQVGGISRPLFTIHFNHTLQQLREMIGKETIDVVDLNAQWTKK